MTIARPKSSEATYAKPFVLSATTLNAFPTSGTNPSSEALLPQHAGSVVVVVLVVVGHAGVFVRTVGIIEVPAEFHAVTPYVYAVDPLAVVSATGKTGAEPTCLTNAKAVAVLALRYTL